MSTTLFGFDGNVFLLEPGHEVDRRDAGQVQAVPPAFRLWTEARTPTGVHRSLDSPGDPAADELGAARRSGLARRIENRHFLQRLGAAMLVPSVIDGAVQAALQSSRAQCTSVVGVQSIGIARCLNGDPQETPSIFHRRWSSGTETESSAGGSRFVTSGHCMSCDPVRTIRGRRTPPRSIDLGFVATLCRTLCHGTMLSDLMGLSRDRDGGVR